MGGLGRGSIVLLGQFPAKRATSSNAGREAVHHSVLLTFLRQGQRVCATPLLSTISPSKPSSVSSTNTEAVGQLSSSLAVPVAYLARFPRAMAGLDMIAPVCVDVPVLVLCSGVV